MELLLEGTWDDGTGQKFRIFSEGSEGNKTLFIESDENKTRMDRTVQIRGEMVDFPNVSGTMTLIQYSYGGIGLMEIGSSFIVFPN